MHFFIWLTLFIGIMLVVYALIKVGRQKDQGNTAKNKVSDNSKLLLSEVIEELHENTENMVEMFSKREEKLESLLEKADEKIEELEKQVDNADKVEFLRGQEEIRTSDPEAKTTYTRGYKGAYVKSIASMKGEEDTNKEDENKAEKAENYETEADSGANSSKILNFPSYQDKYSEIKEMFKKGYDVTKIAKKTGKDKGEVQLILNLIKKSEESENDELGC